MTKPVQSEAEQQQPQEAEGSYYELVVCWECQHHEMVALITCVEPPTIRLLCAHCGKNIGRWPE